MSELDPEACAASLIRSTDDMIPDGWKTDDIATFWQHMTEHCVVRLVRYKPEIVRHHRLLDRDDDN